jgi:hypothetical protein
LNNALLEEVSSQHESKMMKKLEQMEGGPKSMDQIPAKMTKPHLPLGRGLDPNLDQVPSQLACQLCGQLPLLMEHPQRPEHLPTSNLGPAIKMTGYSKLYEVNLSSNQMTSHSPKRVHRVHA